MARSHLPAGVDIVFAQQACLPDEWQRKIRRGRLLFCTLKFFVSVCWIIDRRFVELSCYIWLPDRSSSPIDNNSRSRFNVKIDDFVTTYYILTDGHNYRLQDWTPPD